MNTARAFDNLAEVAWKSLELAFSTGVQLGEDAITSYTLLSLSQFLSGVRSNAVIKDTRKDESKIGADFELWIGERIHGWRRYAVQAKRISAKSGGYRTLNHRVRGRRQIDILEDFARANSAAPVYCFYNYFVPSSSVVTNCALGKLPETLGISVTPSSVVQRALATRGMRCFQSIHSDGATIPWSCLVECPKVRHQTDAVSWPTSTTDRFEEFTNFHQELPAGIEHILTSRTEFVSDLWGVYNYECALLPKLVAVVDLTNSRRCKQ